MAEELCSYNKDTFLVKLPKTSPLILRLIVLVIATVCGVYICSICLKQLSSQTKSMIEVFERPNCVTNHVDNSYIHFPQPKTFNRAECAGNPVRFFVIISMQRSGSGWFETLLNSHINVSSNGEIFSIKERRDNISSIIKTLDKVYNLDWFTSASKNECSAAVGFKWMLNQKLMDAQDFLGVPRTQLSSRQVKIHKGPLCDHIKNWDEVRKTLSGTAYESFLEADY